MSKGAPKAREETVYEVQWYWVEELVQKEYGVDLQFQAAMECGNDTTHRMNVSGVVDDPDELQDFLNGGYSDFSTTELVMNDLCKNGKLEPGIYLVEISY